MTAFKKYESKPITRIAYEVEKNDIIFNEKEESTSGIVIADTLVKFKHYEPVKTGDFIVYINDSDIYHCDRAVFIERNIVE